MAAAAVLQASKHGHTRLPDCLAEWLTDRSLHRHEQTKARRALRSDEISVMSTGGDDEVC